MYSDETSAYAIGLTSQTDCYSLTQYMEELLRSLPFLTGATLFEVCQSWDEGAILRRFSRDLDEERMAAGEPGLAQVATRRTPLEIPGPDGGTRLVFPVESTDGPLRLICIDAAPGTDIQPWERVLLLNLVTLYRNQVRVLDSKERDSLTGLLNRQTFNLRLMQVMELRRQRGGWAWLAVLDLDHFKAINDRYGHLYGDEVLLQLSQLMQRHFRYTDFLFRFGGEEFVVLLTHSSMDGAGLALERFRALVEHHWFPTVGRVTLSMGYTRVDGGVLPTGLVDRADQALYRAKERGRNQVVAYADLHQTEDGGVQPAVELF